MDALEADADSILIRLSALSAHGAAADELSRILDRYLHRIRNRLNGIKLGLYMAQRAGSGKLDSLVPLEARYAELERFVEQFQGFCRPPCLRMIEGALDQFIRDRVASWSREEALQGPRIEVETHGPAWRVAFDPTRLGHGLDVFAASRERGAAPGLVARLRLSRSAEGTDLAWDDLAVRCAERSRAEPPGLPDLSLPVLLRVLGAHGAMIQYRGPFSFRARWPSSA